MSREREGGLMGNGFKPRVLVCVECDEEFVFTIEAQQYFAERGYNDDPRRCKFCHTQYKRGQRNQAVRTPDSSVSLDS